MVLCKMHISCICLLRRLCSLFIVKAYSFPSVGEMFFFKLKASPITGLLNEVKDSWVSKDFESIRSYEFCSSKRLNNLIGKFWLNLYFVVYSSWTMNSLITSWLSKAQGRSKWVAIKPIIYLPQASYYKHDDGIPDGGFTTFLIINFHLSHCKTSNLGDVFLS